MAAKSKTTSSRLRKQKAQDKVASQVPENVLQKATANDTVAKDKLMSEEELGSIVEFSEDVADQEAPDPLPNGEYEAQVKNAEVKVSTTSGKKYCAVTFYVGTDQYPADYPVENAPDGVSIIYRMVPLEDNPQARFRLKTFMLDLGVKPSKRVDVSQFVGCTAKIGIAHEEYEGIPREVIKKVSAL